MIPAIVLAAGEARRFGSAKQLALIDGAPVLEHVLRNLRRFPVIVVLGAYADEIRSRVRFENERIVVNPDYARGMSTSIRAGLRALPAGAPAALMVLGDQPFVKPETYERIAAAYRPPNAVVPVYKGVRGNPVVVDRRYFADMMGIEGDMGFRAVLGDAEELEVDDPGVLRDIDSAADVE